jgi:hypothetical protein
MRSTTAQIKTLAFALSALSLLASRNVAAQVGPGIGNIDCGNAEYFQPFAFVENDSGPMGTNVSLIIRGYFMTIFAPDSGLPPGEIGLYDVSNPRQPREVRHIEGGDTNAFREAHSLPVAWIDGGLYVAIQTIAGIQFWDFTDPMTASRIGSLDLPGVAGGDYENVAWQATWQGRYLYVSGGNQGIYVIDAADPRNPVLLEQVSTSRTGGFRVGPLFALGDYLVISNMDQNGAYAVLDISVPDQPALLSQLSNAPRMYAIVVGGNDRIYTAGRDGNFLTHSFVDPTNIVLVKDAFIGQDQLYAAAQDQFVFLGRQNNVIKVDVTDEQNPAVVGEGTLGRDHPDHGQVTPLGNLIFIGNDHGTGSAFFCHQYGTDTTPPAIQSTYPKDGSTWTSTDARVGILFSDYIDTETILGDNVQIRPVGGEPISGILSYTFNTLSFGPDAPLEPDTTYELVMPAGGVSDVMGNALSDDVVVRFSTGASVEIPVDGTGGGSGTGEGGAGGALPATGGVWVGTGGLSTGGVWTTTGGALPATGGGLPTTGGAPPQGTGGATGGFSTGGQGSGIGGASLGGAPTGGSGFSTGSGTPASTTGGVFTNGPATGGVLTTTGGADPTAARRDPGSSSRGCAVAAPGGSRGVLHASMLLALTLLLRRRRTRRA